MTTTSLPQDPTEIIASVESFFDALPVKRQRRTKAEIYAPVDVTPEAENYSAVTDDTSIACELDHESQVQMFLLLQHLALARGVTAANVAVEKICALLGLSEDLPSYKEALGRTSQKSAK